MKKLFRKFCVLSTCVAFLTAAAVFFGACATTEDWVRSMIIDHYFRIDGDYSSLSGLDGLSIPEMMARLDVYSRYYTPEEISATLASNSGSKSGLGISYSYDGSAGNIVSSVVGSSPAEQAGIKAGDVIVSGECNGVTSVFSSREDMDRFIDARADGETFTLGRREGGPVSLAKAEYTASYAKMYTHGAFYGFKYEDGVRKTLSGEGLEILPEDTAYVYISQFYGGAADEMAELIKIFRELDLNSLIIDLRGDGGGDVEVMRKIGGLLASEKTGGAALAQTAKFKNGSEERIYCEYYPQNALPKDSDVYVMADKNTASASEALIGVLISYGMTDYGDVFVSDYGNQTPRTYGKGIMQYTYINRNSRDAIKLTVAGVYWPNGVTIHGVGLNPSMGCSVAPASDSIVSIGLDDELVCLLSSLNT